MFKRFGVLAAILPIFVFSAPPTKAARNAVAEPTTDLTNSTARNIETVVIIRHAEKTSGSGQLSPQGFNRAIALSELLPRKFGRPAALFAPDPSEKHEETVGFENYVRPLATIEPTAIRLGLPVNTLCGFRDDDEMVDELSMPRYASDLIFVAWEHKDGEAMAAGLMKNFGGDVKSVPTWPKTDFDSIYIVKIDRTSAGHPAVTFTHEHEGLDGQSTEMPRPAAK